MTGSREPLSRPSLRENAAEIAFRKSRPMPCSRRAINGPEPGELPQWVSGLFDDRTQDAHLAALIDAHDNGGDGETIIVGQCQPAVKQWHDSLAVVVRDLRQRP